MNLEKIYKAIEGFCKENKVKLFEAKYHKNDCTLTVLLDEKLNMDELEMISNKLSEYLDRYEDEFEDNYFLDVSNVGAERPIRNEEELNEAIGSYIYVKTKDEEYYGDFRSYSNGVISLDVKQKNRIKNVSLEYKNTKKVRYAVKF